MLRTISSWRAFTNLLLKWNIIFIRRCFRNLKCFRFKIHFITCFMSFMTRNIVRRHTAASCHSFRRNMSHSNILIFIRIKFMSFCYRIEISVNRFKWSFLFFLCLCSYFFCFCIALYIFSLLKIFNKLFSS